MVLICIFLLISNIEHFFCVCLLVICMSIQVSFIKLSFYFFDVEFSDVEFYAMQETWV